MSVTNIIDDERVTIVQGVNGILLCSGIVDGRQKPQMGPKPSQCDWRYGSRWAEFNMNEIGQ